MKSACTAQTSRHLGFFALVLHKASLPANLCGNLVVRKTRSRKQRDLLSTSDGIHDIDGGDASLDHLFGVGPFSGVDGRPIDVQKRLCKDRRSVFRWLLGGIIAKLMRISWPYPPSTGLPDPLKMRPSMSRDTGVFNTWKSPVKM